MTDNFSLSDEDLSAMSRYTVKINDDVKDLFDKLRFKEMAKEGKKITQSMFIERLLDCWENPEKYILLKKKEE